MRKSILAALAAALLLAVTLSAKHGTVDASGAPFSEALTSHALSLELPCFYSPSPDAQASALSLVLPGSLINPEDESDASADNRARPEISPEPASGDLISEQNAVRADEEGTGEPSEENDGENDGENEEGNEEESGRDGERQSAVVDTTITGAGSSYEHLAEGITLKNKTDYTIDVESLLSEELDFSFTEGNAEVLILHTHGSEAYTQSGDDVYTPSDPYRTTDESFNVVRVGDELADELTKRGISVIHDRELYDYPSYNGSYSRAWKAITEYLDEYPDIRVIIDLHRDALMDSDGRVYKTVADIGDVPCAQVMLIAGTNFSGLSHPNWKRNLSFALKLQAEMNSSFPTLARPLCLSQYRYNQNATTGSLIAEVGTNGNTLQEALTAVRYFGECLAAVLLRT